MPEEFGLGIDDAGEGGEAGGEQASEAAEQRARDDTTKASQVRTQIKQIQQQNTQFALMLSILLQTIHDEAILGVVFTQLIEKKIPTPAIFAQFLPYLQDTTDLAPYQSLYGELREKLPIEKNVSSLVAWLKEVRSVSAGLQAISGDEYTKFTLSYLAWMKVIDMASLEPEKKKALEESVRKEVG